MFKLLCVHCWSSARRFGLPCWVQRCCIFCCGVMRWSGRLRVDDNNMQCICILPGLDNTNIKYNSAVSSDF